jgi:hypothetical protein
LFGGHHPNPVAQQPRSRNLFQNHRAHRFVPNGGLSLGGGGGGIARDRRRDFFRVDNLNYANLLSGNVEAEPGLKKSLHVLDDMIRIPVGLCYQVNPNHFAVPVKLYLALVDALDLTNPSLRIHNPGIPGIGFEFQGASPSLPPGFSPDIVIF